MARDSEAIAAAIIFLQHTRTECTWLLHTLSLSLSLSLAVQCALHTIRPTTAPRNHSRCPGDSRRQRTRHHTCGRFFRQPVYAHLRHRPYRPHRRLDCSRAGIAALSTLPLCGFSARATIWLPFQTWQPPPRRNRNAGQRRPLLFILLLSRVRFGVCATFVPVCVCVWIFKSPPKRFGRRNTKTTRERARS